MEHLQNLLMQNSTWRGVIAIVGAIGIVMVPDRIAEITAAVLALIGGINVARSS